MKYRTLGRTGLWVSEVSLGAMTLGGRADDPIWGAVGALHGEEASRLVLAALDAGINYIDTADTYGGGESEDELGRILAGRRDSVLIASKAGGSRSGPGPNDLGATRVHLTRSIENSLRKLRTDYIDLYELHIFDHLTALDESLAALDDAVRQGKIRHIGASNFDAWHIAKALGISALRQISGFVSAQTHYSLLVRDVEMDLLPLAESENLGVMVWGPLAAGYLTGKFDSAGGTGESSSRRATNPQASIPPVDPVAAAPVLEVVRAVAERNNATSAQVALAWILARPVITSVTIGARTPERLLSNLQAVDLQLSAQDLADLDEVSAPAPRYPHWLNRLAELGRGPVPR
ncbi:aldo/keto reductase [Actinoplanes sp. TBRC 11911]|uniref:aldo/keto reductase n=1 Tax=Actinoplanes sp. TBRC 11911 TaxID=2729386 RepID=UPI00145F74F8|nr:aldo/keto reductase [Actinoplanes sp. TBRC 11911]NMO55238.1 aldo/keto reductase [Actinoplanes sp. TBRC 11911]